MSDSFLQHHEDILFDFPYIFWVLLKIKINVHLL